MSPAFAGAVMLSLAASLLPARVTSPMGRAPKPGHGLSPPKMWQDRTGHFALERPAAERWMLRSGVRGPDGEPVPLLAMSQETGAQLVVQTADGIHDIRLLARMLMENLFFFSSRRRHTRWPRDWSSDVCSSDLGRASVQVGPRKSDMAVGT